MGPNRERRAETSCFLLHNWWWFNLSLRVSERGRLIMQSKAHGRLIAEIDFKNTRTKAAVALLVIVNGETPPPPKAPLCSHSRKKTFNKRKLTATSFECGCYIVPQVSRYPLTASYFECCMCHLPKHFSLVTLTVKPLKIKCMQIGLVWLNYFQDVETSQMLQSQNT